jgi:hypothetical protein
VAVPSKECVCSSSLPGIVGSNPAGARITLLSVVCCQVDVSASADHPSRGVLPNVVCV